VTQSAVERWRAVLGDQGVDTTEATLARIARATFRSQRRVTAVLRPHTIEQVMACLQIASACAAPVYPVSRGRNWGFGSRVPAADGCAVLDLGALDAITAFDETLGYVQLQPGVTFEQLHRYLRARNSRWFLAAIGGPPDGSVIGNSLERGDAAGPNADRLASLCALDVVLPTGERVRTGFGRHGAAELRHLSNRAAGPQLDGLFTQSNLGVVVGATVWLTERPGQLLLFTGEIGAHLPGFFDAFRSLVAQGVVAPMATSVWHPCKLALRDGQVPPAARPAATGEPWLFSGALYAASRDIALAQRDHIAAALAPHVGSIAFLGEEDDAEFAEIAGTFLGVPSADNVATMYWPKGRPAPQTLDPDGDGCGLQWVCVTVPFRGEIAARALIMAEAVMTRAGFLPVIALDVTTSRCLQIFIALYYDADDEEADRRACRCHDDLLDAFARQGVYPYRLGIQSMGRLGSPDEPLAGLVRRLKTAVDPGGVLAPGRYDFGSATTRRGR